MVNEGYQGYNNQSIATQALDTSIDNMKRLYEECKVKKAVITQKLTHGKLTKVAWLDLNDKELRSDINVEIDKGFFADGATGNLT